MGCTLDDFWSLAGQLPGVGRHDHDRYWRLEVAGRNVEGWRVTSSPGSSSRPGG